MSTGFFLAKQRLGLAQSLRAYGLFLLPLLLQPFVSLMLHAFAPAAALFLSSGYFLAAAVLSLWPLAFKDASSRFWVVGCLGWFALVVLSQAGAALVA
ncbi:hypothetical protein UUC_17550 [Rhodanobacter denitrificans]|nr:hypothetical protein UUC_17550 [Rhodanobacter denitrificans]